MSLEVLGPRVRPATALMGALELLARALAALIMPDDRRCHFDCKRRLRRSRREAYEPASWTNEVRVKEVEGFS